jgi:ABC-type transport system involved in cytochrome bd biosynthesis fused ATPase/permease subunit
VGALLGWQHTRRRLSHFAFVPQQPVLFYGTLRENLDPCGRISDEQLAAALQVRCSVRMLEGPDPHSRALRGGAAKGLVLVSICMR